ncbi:kinase-like domain-containing protein [Morchella snyderi]|nr:kinase-like domain-containing protein [Morchella snyderi]
MYEEEPTILSIRTMCTLIPLSPVAYTLMKHLTANGCLYVKTPPPHEEGEYSEESGAENGDSDAATDMLGSCASDIANHIRIELPVGKFEFGKSQKCHIVLTKAKLISRQHFSIFINVHGVLMLENYSQNGTFVNDTLVGKQYALFAGDTITVVGDGFHLRFQVQISPTPKTARPNHGISGYQIMKPIGAGTCGAVNLAVEKATGKLFAIKTIKINSQVEDYLHEADILHSLDHKHIVRYFNSFDSEGKLFIVMEYIEKGNLGAFLTRRGCMHEDMVQQASRQILGAVVYMHSMDIVHRDLKLENVLIVSYEPLLVKVSDFGLAKVIPAQDSAQNTFCGTRLYLAPEAYPEYNMTRVIGGGSSKRKRHPKEDDGPEKAKLTKRYKKAVDMWSFGCVVHMLLTCKPAFAQENDDTAMLGSIMRGFRNTSHLDKIITSKNRQNVKDFLMRLLHAVPLERMTPDAALKHVWLNKQEEMDDELILPMPGRWPV